MLGTMTQSDSGLLVWSPSADRLAYVTPQGLQVYLSDPTSNDERYVMVSPDHFVEINWSPTGQYLTAYRADGVWFVYRFDHMTATVVYTMKASSVDWLEEHQLIYVPDAGGLVLVYLGGTNTEIVLAG